MSLQTPTIAFATKLLPEP
ncbi:hypothetical protein D030_1271A, partial [Vibrio parahaemolyticus AQ3810]